MKTVAMLALLSGCAGSYSTIDFSRIGETPPGAEEAIRIIAADYGLKYQPNIYWYGKGFDCTSLSYSWVPDGESFCIDGVFNPWSQDIAISNYGLFRLPHEIPLAHEICHQYDWEHGIADDNHESECFQTGGRVERENQKLYELGL